VLNPNICALPRKIQSITIIDKLETQLSSDDTTVSIIELDEFVGDLRANGDDMDKATESQKQFYYILCMEKEVKRKMDL